MALKLAPSRRSRRLPRARLGDGDHVALEQTAGVGVGQHDGGDLRRELLLHLLGIDRAIRTDGHGLHAITQQRCRRRVGAVRRFGTSTTERLSPRASSAALMAIIPHSSPCGAGLGRHGDRRHARELAEPARQLGDQRDRARHGGERLQRVDVAEPGSRAMRSLRRGLCFMVHEPSGNSPVSMP
jgi:hypothetical protein